MLISKLQLRARPAPTGHGELPALQSTESMSSLGSQARGKLFKPDCLKDKSQFRRQQQWEKGGSANLAKIGTHINN